MNLRKTKITFIVDLKTLIHKTSLDPKLLKLEFCLQYNQKEHALEEVSQVFGEVT